MKRKNKQKSITTKKKRKKKNERVFCYDVFVVICSFLYIPDKLAFSLVCKDQQRWIQKKDSWTFPVKEGIKDDVLDHTITVKDTDLWFSTLVSSFKTGLCPICDGIQYKWGSFKYDQDSFRCRKHTDHCLVCGDHLGRFTVEYYECEYCNDRICEECQDDVFDGRSGCSIVACKNCY